MLPATTICAIATAPGTAGVGIVRISGPQARAILAQLCPSLPNDLTSHRLYLTRAVWPEPPFEPLDQILAVFMQAPRSYTGEDVVELQAHGGPLNMRRILEATCRAGAEVAGPGEFTQRAFLHGRLDLTQAEAVADIIHASSNAALTLAQRHLRGELGRSVQDLRRALVEAVTLTEAAIDFSTEEHVYQLDVADLARRSDDVIAQIARLLGTYDAGRQVREGIRVVILGQPNAGKSTLFNHLCGMARAIVTDIPGTTRDYLEELVTLEGISLRLIDTAGLRHSDDRVEQIGVARSLEQVQDADLVLWVVDATAPFSLHEHEQQALETLQGHGSGNNADILALLNKTDLCDKESAVDALAAKVEALAHRAPLRVSLLETLPETLTTEIVNIATARLQPAQEGAVITRQRHRNALSRGRESMERAREAALAGLSHEFIALDLRLALETLGELTGRVSVDDLLTQIFSEFCVGK